MSLIGRAMSRGNWIILRHRCEDCAIRNSVDWCPKSCLCECHSKPPNMPSNQCISCRLSNGKDNCSEKCQCTCHMNASEVQNNPKRDQRPEPKSCTKCYNQFGEKCPIGCCCACHFSAKVAAAAATSPNLTEPSKPSVDEVKAAIDKEVAAFDKARSKSPFENATLGDRYTRYGIEYLYEYIGGTAKWQEVGTSKGSVYTLPSNAPTPVPTSGPVQSEKDLTDREIALVLLGNRDAVEADGNNKVLSDNMYILLDELLKRIAKYKIA